MKRKILLGTLMVSVFGLPLTAMASDLDCFPMCAEPARFESKIAVGAKSDADAINDWAPGEIVIIVSARPSCDSGFVKTVDDMNDKVKPIRELVGYVRSPQGLAIKLVNDHIVKIPAWIGYVVDPLGSLKHQAIDEVRTRARDALADGGSCATVPSNSSGDVTDAIDSKHSI